MRPRRIPGDLADGERAPDSRPVRRGVRSARFGRAPAAVLVAAGLALTATTAEGVGAPSIAVPASPAVVPVAASAADPVAGPVLEPYPVGEVASETTATPEATPTPTAGSSGSAAPQVTDEFPGTPLDPARVSATLGPLLQGGPLGPGRTPATVIDVATGAVLYTAADRPSIPASTTKLVTAVSVLEALDDDAVLTTRTAVLNPDAATPRVVLVGGGDPTLASTGGRIGGSGTSISPASLRRLARDTAQALGADARVRIGYDDTPFTGPALHPTWSRSFPAGGIVAPVSALSVDQGRRTPNGVARVADPALAAAEGFADELERAGVQVVGRIRATPLRADSTPLASVTSPPIGVLVERMLATSDNDIAESLARLAAQAVGLPASFTGVEQRARAVLAAVGSAAASDRVVDGSGLSRRNRLTPSTLTTMLRQQQHLGALSSGLPVAAATGSLRARFTTDATQAAAGLARLKTGTLTAVTGLAGFVSRPDGRLLAVAFVDGSTSGATLTSRAALDRAVAALVRCSCSTSGA